MKFIDENGNRIEPIIDSATNALKVKVAGAVSITQESITSTISYIANTTNVGGGYSVGDHITATLFWNISNIANPAFLIAAWYNWDTAAEIATPNMAHLTAVAEDALTDTQLNSRLDTLFGYSATSISTATTTTIKSGEGRVGVIHVSGGTAGTVIVYDNTAGSGTKIIDIDSTNNASFDLNCEFGIGLTVVTSAATKVTITWK